MTDFKRFAAAMILAITVASGSMEAIARPINILSYEEMKQKADLIVIATPIARKELPNKTTMPGVTRGNDPIPATQIETTFRVKSVLGGEVTAEKKEEFVLLHLIETNPPKMIVNGQMLVDFKPDSKADYLMYLKRGQDGRYESVNGQTDPAPAIKPLPMDLSLKP